MIKVVITPHKYSKSRKNTSAVAKIIPVPNVIKNITVNGTTAKNTCQLILIGIIIEAPTNTIKDIKNITKLDKIVAKGYIYLGTYTFLIMLEFVRIDLAAAFVPPLKNENNNRPDKI